MFQNLYLQRISVLEVGMGHGLLTTQRKARGGLLSQHVGLGSHQTHFPDWGLMRRWQAPLHTWAGWMCGRC